MGGRIITWWVAQQLFFSVLKGEKNQHGDENFYSRLNPPFPYLKITHGFVSWPIFYYSLCLFSPTCCSQNPPSLAAAQARWYADFAIQTLLNIMTAQIMILLQQSTAKTWQNCIQRKIQRVKIAAMFFPFNLPSIHPFPFPPTQTHSDPSPERVAFYFVWVHPI